MKSPDSVLSEIEQSILASLPEQVLPRVRGILDALRPTFLTMVEQRLADLLREVDDGPWMYAAVNRPPGYATIPDGSIAFYSVDRLGRDTIAGRHARHGYVEYPRPLTFDEMEGFELYRVVPAAKFAARISETLSKYATDGDTLKDIEKNLERSADIVSRRIIERFREIPAMTTEGLIDLSRNELYRIMRPNLAVPADEYESREEHKFFQTASKQSRERDLDRFVGRVQGSREAASGPVDDGSNLLLEDWSLPPLPESLPKPPQFIPKSNDVPFHVRQTWEPALQYDTERWAAIVTTEKEWKQATRGRAAEFKKHSQAFAAEETPIQLGLRRQPYLRALRRSDNDVVPVQILVFVDLFESEVPDGLTAQNLTYDELERSISDKVSRTRSLSDRLGAFIDSAQFRYGGDAPVPLHFVLQREAERDSWQHTDPCYAVARNLWKDYAVTVELGRRQPEVFEEFTRWAKSLGRFIVTVASTFRASLAVPSEASNKIRSTDTRLSRRTADTSFTWSEIHGFPKAAAVGSASAEVFLIKAATGIDSGKIAPDVNRQVLSICEKPDRAEEILPPAASAQAPPYFLTTPVTRADLYGKDSLPQMIAIAGAPGFVGFFHAKEINRKADVVLAGFSNPNVVQSVEFNIDTNFYGRVFIPSPTVVGQLLMSYEVGRAFYDYLALTWRAASSSYSTSGSDTFRIRQSEIANQIIKAEAQNELVDVTEVLNLYWGVSSGTAMVDAETTPELAFRFYSKAYAEFTGKPGDFENVIDRIRQEQEARSKAVKESAEKATRRQREAISDLSRVEELLSGNSRRSFASLPAVFDKAQSSEFLEGWVNDANINVPEAIYDCVRRISNTRLFGLVLEDNGPVDITEHVKKQKKRFAVVPIDSPDGVRPSGTSLLVSFESWFSVTIPATLRKLQKSLFRGFDAGVKQMAENLEDYANYAESIKTFARRLTGPSSAVVPVYFVGCAQDCSFFTFDEKQSGAKPAYVAVPSKQLDLIMRLGVGHGFSEFSFGYSHSFKVLTIYSNGDLVGAIALVVLWEGSRPDDQKGVAFLPDTKMMTHTTYRSLGVHEKSRQRSQRD